MGISPLAASNGGQSSQSSQSGSSGTGALGESMFLKLLVAQLQYQNPMQPMSGTQFVTQLATFQTVTELQSIKADLDQLVQLQAQLQAQLATGGTAKP